MTVTDPDPADPHGDDEVDEAGEPGAPRVLMDALADDDSAALKRIREFAARHPGDVTAVVNHIGRRGARVVLIAADGNFGDVVVSSVAAAERVCSEAGLTVGSWDRQTSALLSPEPADRIKMRGTGR
jgi:hypothetical protein